jgi:elongation factor P
MINATEIKKGMVIKYGDDFWVVLEYTHTTPGNWRGMVHAKLKNLKSGGSMEQRFRANERLETAFIEQIEMEFLYDSGDDFCFMDLTSYEQLTIQREIVGDAAKFIKPNFRVKVSFCEKNAIGVELPTTVELKVVETEPGLKGATVTNVEKPAKLETGVTVKVPPFIEAGEVVIIDTRDGNYVGRVK